MADHGIAVATYDHLGHGKTVKTQADLGFFADEHPMQSLLKDVIVMADQLQARHPEVPHFVMGHSMGSFIVRNVLKHHAHRFAGAILIFVISKNGHKTQIIEQMIRDYNFPMTRKKCESLFLTNS